jgi:hypothetical protein
MPKIRKIISVPGAVFIRAVRMSPFWIANTLIHATQNVWMSVTSVIDKDARKPPEAFCPLPLHEL